MHLARSFSPAPRRSGQSHLDAPVLPVVMAGLVPAIVRVQARFVWEVQVLPRLAHRPEVDRNCVARERMWEATEDEGAVCSNKRTRFGRADRRACDGKAKPGPVMSGKPVTLSSGCQSDCGGR